ncbi:MAG: hypothetical protein NC935_05725 [Candidatus Omnitrophica bacterium]|nr:hypothetical protein [Candidatus Omnitrophota bacterium]
MLSEQAILEFQQLYKKKFGEEIVFNKAKEEAIKFLQFFKLIFKPINHEKNKS